MKVYGYDIPEDIFARAIKKAAERSDNKDVFTARTLSRTLQEHFDVPYHNGQGFVATPAATRIITEYRKAGKLRRGYGGGGNTQWHIVPEEEPCE